MASTRTASGPPAARARKPSSIHLLRGVRVIAAMASHYHVRELTAPLAVLAFIYTVAYRWRPRYAAPGRGAPLPPLAHPPAHQGLPARGRVGTADAGRPGRLPTAGAVAGLARRPVASLRLLRRPRALGDPVEGRRAARLGRPGRRPRGGAAAAARPAAGGPARRPTPARLRRPPLQLAVPDRRPVA